MILCWVPGHKNKQGNEASSGRSSSRNERSRRRPHICATKNGGGSSNQGEMGGKKVCPSSTVSKLFFQKEKVFRKIIVISWNAELNTGQSAFRLVLLSCLSIVQANYLLDGIEIRTLESSNLI